MADSVLEVRDLAVQYQVRKGVVSAVNGVTFALGRAETLGLVGESGCGKTTVAKAVMRLLPPRARVAGGRVLFKGQDLLRLNTGQLNRLRWEEIAIVSQSAMNVLDPVYRVRDQILEAIRAHRKLDRAAAMERIGELCDLVGIEVKRLWDYPHQLSGGMKQRFVLAMALALKPSVLIADEPTTALDLITQDRVLERIRSLQSELGFSMLYISHDMGVIAEVCDRVAVMYAGCIVECGPARVVFKRAYHPYTMGLRNAFPNLRQSRDLVSIPGFPPDLLNVRLDCCLFRPRCPFALPRCRVERPPAREVEPGHVVACHRLGDALDLRERSRRGQTWQPRPAA